MKFRGNGKLLITGEYVVLDGTEAFALPTKYGQELKVNETNNEFLSWKSFDEQNTKWLDVNFSFENNILIPDQRNAFTERLSQILNTCLQLNKDCINSLQNKSIETYLDFNRNWGLGTSSTLIYTLSEWLKINPYELLEATFGGSGYDIACASVNSPLVYQIKDSEKISQNISFENNFKENLYFIFLNQKMNSREGIKHYKTNFKKDTLVINRISELTNDLIKCTNLSEFNTIIEEHEKIIGEITNQTPIQQKLFSDYEYGNIKSLGAWGGDFILATSKTNPTEYFKEKGYNTILKYSEIII